MYAGSHDRPVQGTYCLQPLEHWDFEFESHSRHGYVSTFLCRSVSVVALRQADPPSRESYQMSKNRFISFKRQILNRKSPEGLIRIHLPNIMLHTAVCPPNANPMRRRSPKKSITQHRLVPWFMIYMHRFIQICQ